MRTIWDRQMRLYTGEPSWPESGMAGALATVASLCRVCHASGSHPASGPGPWLGMAFPGAVWIDKPAAG